jgi:subtilisin-like proprotein convertase family protein
LPPEQNVTVSKTFNTLIPDDRSVQTFSVEVSTDIRVEWIEVTIDNNSTYASDYRIELISPVGTRVTLMTEDTSNGIYYIPYGDWMNGGFRFGTAAMLDESSQGTWNIELRDMLSGDTGTLKSVQLNIYGH